MPDKKINKIIGLLKSLKDTDSRPSTRLFDPGHYVSVVNQLIPEGKDVIIAAIRKYHRSEDTKWAFDLNEINLLMLLLFRPAWGHTFKPVADVMFLLGSPTNRRDMPYFPLALIDDIPIYTMSVSYIPEGISEINDYVLDFLNNVSRYGILRQKLLKPSSTPLAVLNKLLLSRQWYWSPNCPREKKNDSHSNRPYEKKEKEHAIQDAMSQLLRLVRRVYPPAETLIVDDMRGYKPITVSQWNQVYFDVSRLHLEWDLQQNRYRLL